MSKKFTLNVKTDNPEQQELVRDILSSMKTRYVEKIDIEITDKKFLPYEIGLLILIEFVAQISAELIIRFLDKLWEKLNQNKISMVLEDIPRVQIQAENYLKSISVHSFEIREMSDNGLYARFIFLDNKGELHDLYVSKTDFQVLKYSRRKFP